MLHRTTWALLLPLCGLAACNRHAPPPPPEAAMPAAPAPMQNRAMGAKAAWFKPAPAQQPGMHLAYTHDIGLEVAGGALAAHFTAARDRCLNTPALHCMLMQAEIGTLPTFQGFRPDPVPQKLPSASLRVRLPHDQVAPFVNALTDPLPGEKPGLVQVVRQSTSAEDLGRPIEDATQRMAQLTDYLASLKALGSRLTISVSDLVKIASETAQAQTELEEAQARQRDLSLQVDTEEVDVGYAAQAAAAPPPADPIQLVLDGAEATLRSNAAEALDVAIAALPWVPVGLVGLILLWILRRAVFGRRLRV